MEDMLVDTANILAELAHDDLLRMPIGGTLDGSRFAAGVRDYASRPVDAKIRNDGPAGGPGRRIAVRVARQQRHWHLRRRDLGSVLLFVVLAAVMVATRRIDWYAMAAQLRDDALPARKAAAPATAA